MTEIFRIAVAALFLSIGAKDHEITPAMAILNASKVAEGIPALIQQARDALALVRLARPDADTFYCGAFQPTTEPNGFRCTLTADHGGQVHEARAASTGILLARWSVKR